VGFARHLPHLTVMVNGIYWDPRDPRLVTWDDLDGLWQRHEPAGESPRLRVIADLSCDVEGSVEATVEQTDPDEPVFVADPSSRSTTYGVEGRGPVILAVGNLPAEFPRDASEHFGDALFPFLEPLAQADFDAPFGHLALPAPVANAVIAHRSELTPSYRHLAESLEGVPA
jgi:alpha-aminoadipic semialdehyde synthase